MPRPPLPRRIAWPGPLLAAAALLVLALACGRESPYCEAPEDEDWQGEHAAFSAEFYTTLADRVAARLAPAAGDPPAATRGRLRFHRNPNAIARIVADPDDPHLLWLATAGGVVRYDRRHRSWQRWGRTEGLAAHSLSDLWLDAERDELWAVGFKGVAVRTAASDRWCTLVSGRNQIQRRFVKQVRPDPSDPRRLLFVGFEHLIRLDREAMEWEFLPIPEEPLDLIAPADPSRWIVVGEKHLWRTDAVRGTREEVLQADQLRALIGAPREGPEIGIRFTSATPLDEQRVALMTVSDGIFVYDLTQPPGALDAFAYPAGNHQLAGDCRRPRLLRAGDRLFLAGEGGCWGEIGPDLERWQPLLPPPAAVRDLVADDEDPQSVWLATSEGLIRYHLATGRAEWHRDAASVPGGTNAVDLEVTAGRLWVAFLDGALSVLDLAAGSWETVPGLCGVEQIVAGSRPGKLLVVGGLECLGETFVWSLDVATRACEPAALPWDRLFSHPLHVTADEGAIRMVGQLNGGGVGFASFGPREERFLKFDEEVRGDYFLAPDATGRHTAWLAAGDRLLRFDARSVRIDPVRPGIRRVGTLSDSRLWILGQELEILDPQAKASVALGVAGWPTEDPTNPRLLWVVGEDRISLVHLDGETPGRVETLALLPPHLHVWDLAFTSEPEPRLWIATNDGILELGVSGD